MTDQQITIYALIDPRTDAIRYIGKSANPDVRYASHCTASSPLRAVRAWITELAKRKLRPRLRLLEVVPAASADATEARWIARESGPGLLNRRGGSTGRPLKAAEERASHRVTIRLTAREAAELARISEVLGQGAGDVVRRGIRAVGAQLASQDGVIAQNVAPLK
jgi:hypothetical protein